MSHRLELVRLTEPVFQIVQRRLEESRALGAVASEGGFTLDASIPSGNKVSASSAALL